MEGKPSAQRERFFTRCLPIDNVRCSTAYRTPFDREIFSHQIVAILPQNATELIRFLKTFKIWVF